MLSDHNKMKKYRHMDINKQINRQHKAIYMSPYLRKAQVISPEVWAY